MDKHPYNIKLDKFATNKIELIKNVNSFMIIVINFYSNEIKIRIVRFLFVGILINILVALIYFTLIFLNLVQF